MPAWYDDAKLGVFLHWGLYSVPGWAPQTPDIQELLIRRGPKRMLRENPYAEWYLNSMQIPGSPTRRHHHRVYGADAPYDAFVTAFDDAASGAGLDALASLCQDAGARYVVLTTKHHDGYALWPSQIPHPVKGAYHSRRDLVGELGDAVRSRRMRMGLYYSGGYDWPYNGAVIRRAADVVLAAPHDAAYREYVTAHVLELIDRYRPSVLWNDISWPAGGNLAELFARYYNTVEDGVVNDRWLQPEPVRGAVKQTLLRFGGDLLQLLWPLIPPRRKRLTFGSPRHYDFRTPEYEVLHAVTERKWELARGVGHSFGANRYERPEDIITGTELVRMFCDVISKNGNLLIGVGPRPDGTVPESQQAPLRCARGLALGQRRGRLRQPAVGHGGVHDGGGHTGALHAPRGPRLRPGARHAALEADLLLRRRRLRGDAGAPASVTPDPSNGGSRAAFSVPSCRNASRPARSWRSTWARDCGPAGERQGSAMRSKENGARARVPAPEEASRPHPSSPRARPRRFVVDVAMVDAAVRVQGYDMQRGHHPKVVRRADGAWVVECPECRNDTTSSIPLGIGMPLAAKETAQLLRHNHAGGRRRVGSVRNHQEPDGSARALRTRREQTFIGATSEAKRV